MYSHCRSLHLSLVLERVQAHLQVLTYTSVALCRESIGSFFVHYSD